MVISDVASLVVALATVGSLLYISRQVNVTRQQTKGQFLLALDEQFDRFRAITLRMLNEQGFTPSGNDWIEVWGLMSIFERINIMAEDRILDVALVDRLYGFRLIGIIANDGIYERLQSTGGEWQDFIHLCYAVADHRERMPVVTDTDKAFIERVRTLNKFARRMTNPFSF